MNALKRHAAVKAIQHAHRMNAAGFYYSPAMRLTVRIDYPRIPRFTFTVVRWGDDLVALEVLDCPVCDGHGVVVTGTRTRQSWAYPNGWPEDEEVRCPFCDGSGTVEGPEEYHDAMSERDNPQLDYDGRRFRCEA